MSKSGVSRYAWISNWEELQKIKIMRNNRLVTVRLYILWVAAFASLSVNIGSLVIETDAANVCSQHATIAAIVR
jgi:hypothetical protein